MPPEPTARTAPGIDPALAEALDIIAAVYLSGDCIRTKDGECDAHNEWGLEPDDECPHQRATLFLQRYGRPTEQPAHSAQTRRPPAQ